MLTVPGVVGRTGARVKCDLLLVMIIIGLHYFCGVPVFFYFSIICLLRWDYRIIRGMRM
jgi:hypothetical protein